MSEKDLGGGPLVVWLRKFDALSLRERAMVALAALAVTFFLADAVLLGAWSRQNASLKASLAGQRQEMDRVVAQIDAIKAGAASHPDALARARIEEIEQKIAAIDADLRAATERLVPPERMVELLEGLLKRNQRLHLVKMRTLPVQPLLKDASSTTAQVGAQPLEPQAGQGSSLNLFKHGVELTLRGGYLDMLGYLTQIESLPWQMHWANLELNAREHDRTELTLTLYTLSLDETWLVI